MSQLAKLAQKFPASFIEKAPQGKYGEYVKHHVVNQALLATVGPFDLACVQILRGRMVDTKTGEIHENIIVGAVVRLTCEIDGRTTSVEEAGDCEQPLNWTTDGARLKDAMSDGLKRCAMRIGLGLHLWSRDKYFLDRSLNEEKPNES